MKKATVDVGILPPFFYFLKVRDKLTETVKSFSVNLPGRMTLLQGMRYLEQRNPEFTFHIAEVRNHNMFYLEEVMGQAIGPYQLWEILLHTPPDKVIPITLDYILGMGDTVCLLFNSVTPFEK